MTTADLAPSRCPLCGDDNACGAAAGKGDCWCFTAEVDPEALARVPEQAKGAVCLCRGCASGERRPAGASATELAPAPIVRSRQSP